MCRIGSIQIQIFNFYKKKNTFVVWLLLSLLWIEALIFFRPQNNHKQLVSAVAGSFSPLWILFLFVANYLGQLCFCVSSTQSEQKSRRAKESSHFRFCSEITAVNSMCFHFFSSTISSKTKLYWLDLMLLFVCERCLFFRRNQHFTLEFGTLTASNCQLLTLSR